MKTKHLHPKFQELVTDKFPNFHKSGSIRGMKRLYYGKDSLLVICGHFVYNVTSDPDIYYNFAK